MQKAFKKLLWFSAIFPKKYQDQFSKELKDKSSIKAITPKYTHKKRMSVEL